LFIKAFDGKYSFFIEATHKKCTVGKEDISLT